LRFAEKKGRRSERRLWQKTSWGKVRHKNRKNPARELLDGEEGGKGLRRKKVTGGDAQGGHSRGRGQKRVGGRSDPPLNEKNK